jgi:hypothetical protein
MGASRLHGGIGSSTKMTSRTQLLSSISQLMKSVKNSGSYDERFELLDRVAHLSDVLQLVTNFETKLVTDLDVD